jgi:co-chaperonin GroES (HSP10)
MIKLEPLGSRLLVRLRPLPAQTGLILRVARNESAREAEVIAVGPQVRDAKEGQTVLINPLAGTMVNDEIILSESSILAYIVIGENGDKTE